MNSKVKRKLEKRFDDIVYKINLNRDKNYLWSNTAKIKDFFARLRLYFTRMEKAGIIMEDYKGVYFRINRVACVSLQNIFLDMGGERFITKNDLPKKYNNYFKFAFVRNPYDRIVSCYVSMIKNPRGRLYLKGIAAGFLKFGKFYPDMSFKEFVKAISQISDNIADVHFRSQHTFLEDNKGKLIIDYIAKFENLEEEYKKICKILKIKNPKNMIWLNKSYQKKDYKNFYDNETKFLVEKRYKRDFELFGYKKEL